MAKSKENGSPVAPSSEIITAALAALRNAEFALFDCADFFTRMGRAQKAASCEKFRQQCLEVMEMVEGPEPKLLRRPAPTPAPQPVEAPELPIPQV